MEQKISSEELVELDQNILHAMKPYQSDSSPFIVTKGEGSWITDIDGKQYMDGMSGLMSVNIGYGREELARAAYEQLTRIPYHPLTNSHIPAIRLSEKLNQWLNDDYVFFYSNSGSEANETAFKIVRQYHHKKGDSSRHKFISRYRAYHGNSFGALAATGQAKRKYLYEPLSQGFIHVSPPDIYRSPYSGTEEEIGEAYAKEIERVITWEIDKSVAGVIMEPIITGGGMIIPPDNYLKKVQDICNKHGVLLIIEKVINGCGRTGEKFGHMNYGISPDIITMAKGLTSSYLPLSVTAVRKDLLATLSGNEEYDHFRHINTFGGNPAACALAIKNLEIMERENLIERSAELGELIESEMQGIYNHPNVGDIRNKGLLLGIEIVEDKLSKTPAKPQTLDKIISICKNQGLIIGKN